MPEATDNVQTPETSTTPSATDAALGYLDKLFGIAGKANSIFNPAKPAVAAAPAPAPVNMKLILGIGAGVVVLIIALVAFKKE